MTINSIVEELNDEWFHDGDEVFIEVGKELLEKGLELEEIESIFNRLYYAVASEYGD